MLIIRYTLCEISAAALILIPLYSILAKPVFGGWKRTGMYCLFACYLASVYYLTGLPTITYINPGLNLNLVPFYKILDDLKNCFLNVLLFVPLGLFLSVLWEPYKSFGRILRLGLVFSVAIEILQILVLRATDINDVITNVAGTCLGWKIGRILDRGLNNLGIRISKDNPEHLQLLCASVFLVMFFAQPFVVALFYRIV